MKYRCPILCLLLLNIFSVSAYAQDGTNSTYLNMADPQRLLTELHHRTVLHNIHTGALTYGPDNNLYTAGPFPARHEEAFGSQAVITGQQDGQWHIARSDGKGVRQVIRFGTTRTPPGWLIVESIVVDSAGNIFIGGSFDTDTVKFSDDILISRTLSGETGFLAKFAPSGRILWALHFSNRSEVLALTADRNGNVYACGRFPAGKLSFGGTVLEAQGTFDFFVTKYTGDGKFAWAKGGQTWLMSNYSIAHSLHCDANGNLYLCGFFYGGGLILNDKLILPGGSSDFDQYSFIIRYDPNGGIVWAKSLTGSYNTAHSITVDRNNDIIFTGTFDGRDLDFGNNVKFSSPNNIPHVYLAKVDTAGKAKWAQIFRTRTSSTQRSLFLSSDSRDNIYIAGWFSSPGGLNTTLVSRGEEDIFIMKYSAEGDFAGQNSFGTTDKEWLYGMACDSSGSIALSLRSGADAITIGDTTLYKSEGVPDISFVVYLHSETLTDIRETTGHSTDFSVESRENNILTISFDSPGVAKLQLLDYLGQKAADISGIALEAGMNTVSLPRDIAPGVYFVVLHSAGKVFIRKLLIP